MTAARTSLLVALRRARALSVRADRRPLEYVRWLPGQMAFLSDASKRKLARWGNQWGGKTWAGLADVIWCCEGWHPFREVRPAPIEAWVICASWSQSIAIQQKLWHLLNKDQITEDTLFDPVKGFKGKNPVVKFRNGSILRIKTTGQGGLNLASATIHYALFDEPPTTQRIYSEVQKRVLRTNGTVALTLTPVNAPVDWLQAEVDRGAIVDHHYRLTPENLIPVGDIEPLRLTDGTPMDAAWIEKIIAETPPHEVPVIIHGEWQMRSVERIFLAFREAEMVTATPPDGTVQICLGIDHGSKAGKQISLLVAVREINGHPDIYVIDEYCDETGLSSPVDDAREILAMLKRNRMAWTVIDEAWGDRLYLRGPAMRKSNKDLMAQIAKRLKLKGWKSLSPGIRTVKRGTGHGRGSVDIGVRFLHHAMVRGQFKVSPRCTNLIEALNRWKYAEEYKDPIDALRYALDSYIFHRRRSGFARGYIKRS